VLDRSDRLSAARQDLDLLVGELSTVCGQLEEFATMRRRQCRAKNSWFDMPPGFPQDLRAAAGRLAGTLRALVEAGPDQDPELALSAAEQLSELDAGIAAAVAGTEDVGGSARACTSAIQETMNRTGKRLPSLISHLVNVS